MADVEHHKFFPPSSSARWLKCTASVLPISKLTDADNASYPAAEGTFAHSVFADMLQGGGTYKLGDTEEVDGYTIELTEDMEHYLHQSVEHVQALGSGTVLVEQMVGLRVPYGHQLLETVTGHADVIVHRDDDRSTLHVMDLKYGKGVKVFPERNTQMMLYGAAALSTFDIVFEHIDTVVLHVIQPRLEHFDAWAIDVQELANWVDVEVREAITQALTPELSAFAPSEAACRWCPLVSQCPAAREMAVEGFDILPETLDIDEVDPVTLAAFLDRASYMEQVIKAARDGARKQLLRGEPLPGWKLVKGRSTRVWAADEDEVEVALANDGIEPYTQALKSPPAVEKEMGKKEFSAGCATSLVRYNEGRPTLAPQSDKRETYVPEDAAAGFETLDED